MRWSGAKTKEWLTALGVPLDCGILDNATDGRELYESFCSVEGFEQLDDNLDADCYDGVFDKDEALKQRFVAACEVLSQVRLRFGCTLR